MTELYYDEKSNMSQDDGWAKIYDSDEAIIFTSTYKVGKFGGNGVVEPYSTEDCTWILTRSNNGDWTLQS